MLERLWYFAGCVLVIGQFATLPSEAQEAAASGPAPTASAEGLEEITVTAQKREENVQDVPIAVSVFSGDELTKAGVEEVFDIQYLTPNLSFPQAFDSASAAAVVIRGQSQADLLLTTDTSVGVYVDGVNVPRTLGMRSAAFDLERVEVLKGPQGTLYGRNTTGGALNLISRKPDYDGVSGFAEGSYGNFDHYAIAGAINLPLLADRLAVRLAAQRTSRDGFGKSEILDRELADDDEWFVRGSVRFDPSDSVSVMVIGDYQDIDEHGAMTFPTAYSSVPAWPAASGAGFFPHSLSAGLELGLAPIDPAVAGGQAALLAGLGDEDFDNRDNLSSVNDFSAWGIGTTIAVEFTWATLTSITGYREFDKHGRLDLDGTEFTILHPDLRTDMEFFSEELWLSGLVFEGRLRWLVGGYYSNEEGHDGSETLALLTINPANPSIVDGTVQNESWAFFTQETFEITEGLRLTGGVRYTEEDKQLTSRNRSGTGAFYTCDVAGVPVTATGSACRATFDDTFTGWSWLFGLDYDVTEAVLAYLKASRGFKGGGQNLRGGQDPTSFADFEPEFATSYEIGLKSDLWDNRLRLNAAAFYTDYEDIQRSIIVPSTGGNIVTILTNAAEATIWGFELEALASPIDALTLTGSVGYTDPEYDSFESLHPLTGVPVDRSDEPFPDNPDWKLALGARFEQELGPGTAGLQFNYYWQGEIDNITETIDPTFPSSAVNIDSYDLGNLRVDYRLNDYGLELAVFVNNLFDQEYRTGFLDLSSLGYGIANAGDPRTYGISIHKDF